MKNIAKKQTEEDQKAGTAVKISMVYDKIVVVGVTGYFLQLRVNQGSRSAVGIQDIIRKCKIHDAIQNWSKWMFVHGQAGQHLG